jgi:hypothetical protein
LVLAAATALLAVLVIAFVVPIDGPLAPVAPNNRLLRSIDINTHSQNDIGSASHLRYSDGQETAPTRPSSRRPPEWDANRSH